jgi:hypothetical protein
MRRVGERVSKRALRIRQLRGGILSGPNRLREVPARLLRTGAGNVASESMAIAMALQVIGWSVLTGDQVVVRPDCERSPPA